VLVLVVYHIVSGKLFHRRHRIASAVQALHHDRMRPIGEAGAVEQVSERRLKPKKEFAQRMHRIAFRTRVQPWRR